ncbi:serine/threonine-protein kinase [Streptomyces sp. NPDC001744]|uniref:serine/threonine-protein kinase n=1 Tax=Streptomyces sp. NPDC001744 TaxID=3364606 RepID=UPI00367BFB74
MAAGLSEALLDIHRAGLVHRDLKPGNVLLADDGPRVIDFGISRAGDGTRLTQTGTVVGTPPFMAPEQFTGTVVGPAADVFSLGSVLVHAATGHGPFDGDSAHAIGFRVVYEEPDLTALPDELHPLVTACLTKDPEQRPTVDQLLRTLGADGPLPATPPTLPSPPDVPPAGFGPPLPVTGTSADARRPAWPARRPWSSLLRPPWLPWPSPCPWWSAAWGTRARSPVPAAVRP